MTPGTTLRRMARMTCSGELCESVLDPTIADLQNEWRRSGTRVVLIRGYLQEEAPAIQQRYG
jgi:hypothetical protein